MLWIYNFFGELGYHDPIHRIDLEDLGSRLRYLSLGAARQVAKIMIASRRSCAIFDDGGATCWGGLANYGTLGLFTTHLPDKRFADGSLINLGIAQKAVDMAAGLLHTCVLLESGQVKCFGQNRYGALGYGDIANRDEALDMGEALEFVDLGLNRFATQIVAGEYHTCVLLDNARVKCWG